MCRNEEKIIPYFIKHYAGMVDEIVLIDNDSTDKTAEIAMEMCHELNQKLIYRKLMTDGFNDGFKLQIFKSIHKNGLETNSDWYILIDTDEFIYDKTGDLRKTLQSSYDRGFLFVKPTGYQMSEESFPVYDGRKITDRCKMGCRDKGFDKPVIVHKDLTTWVPLAGCHIAHGLIAGRPVEPDTKHELLMLHYKFLGFEHRLERVRHVLNRLDDAGKMLLQNGIGGHLSASDQILREEYDGIFSRREQII